MKGFSLLFGAFCAVIFPSILSAQNTLGYKATGKTDAILHTEFAAEEYTAQNSYNHPSNIVETQDGSIVVAWAGGASEGERTNIWTARKTSSGWDNGQIIDDWGTIYDPVLIQPRAPGSPIFLYYKRDGNPDAWKGYVVKSTDDGVSWSNKMQLPATSDSYFNNYGGHFVGPHQNPPLEMPDGTFLAGCSNEDGGVDNFRYHIERIPANNYTGNEPGGSDWTVQHFTKKGLIAPAFLVFDPSYQKLGMVIRNGVHWDGHFSKSVDGGDTWTTPEKLNGLKIKTGVAAISLDIDGGPGQGWHLAAGAYASSEFGSGCGLCRDAIHLGASNNEGSSWSSKLIIRLDTDEQADPTLIQTEDKMVHLLWSGRGSDHLKYALLDPYKLLDINAQVDVEKSIKQNEQTKHLNYYVNGNGDFWISLNHIPKQKITVKTFDSMGKAIKANITHRIVNGSLIVSNNKEKNFKGISFLTIFDGSHAIASQKIVLY